ncbi:MAG: hypothetical protein BZ135_09340 [Methanosphaera sp. rholeuAM6]|nr:MAG: hypothetical protein BZ135_09340 [Methanosphaera sp. rholeuAM6]
MKSSQNKYEKFYDKTFITHKSKAGWSLVIREDQLLLDNFQHGYPHIHPDRAEIKTKTLEETVMFVKKHIEKHKTLNIELLREEITK